MRDLPAPTPSAQQALARMYAQRVPSRPKQIGRMPEQEVDQPWYEKVGRAAFGIVASPFATALDVVPGYEPEDIGSFNIFEQGGKSLQHVAGDAYQLGRSVLTGKDTLSESPSARAYQQAGGGLMGTAAAALPYVDVASVVAPFAKAMTPAGALAIERAAGEAASSRALAEGVSTAQPLPKQSVGVAAEAGRLRPPAEPSGNIVIKVLEDPDTGTIRLGAYNTNTETIVGSMEMSPAGDGGPIVVTGLVSDNPIAMLKMLAAAKAKAQLSAPGMEYPLYPDTSLSAYSRPLVERLQRANLVDPQFRLPDPGDINRITRDDWTTGRFTPEIYLGEGVDVNPAEYATIYDETRRALRESRQPGLRPTTPSNQVAELANTNRFERLNFDEDQNRFGLPTESAQQAFGSLTADEIQNYPSAVERLSNLQSSTIDNFATFLDPEGSGNGRDDLIAMVAGIADGQFDEVAIYAVDSDLVERARDVAARLSAVNAISRRELAKLNDYLTYYNDQVT